VIIAHQLQYSEARDALCPNGDLSRATTRGYHDGKAAPRYGNVGSVMAVSGPRTRAARYDIVGAVAEPRGGESGSHSQEAHADVARVGWLARRSFSDRRNAHATSVRGMMMSTCAPQAIASWVLIALAGDARADGPQDR